jgi:hypothetical protein
MKHRKAFVLTLIICSFFIIDINCMKESKKREDLKWPGTPIPQKYILEQGGNPIGQYRQSSNSK